MGSPATERDARDAASDPRDLAARARWDDEGGQPASPPSPEPDALDEPRRAVALPDGYTAQPIELHLEPPFAFELDLVYGPPTPHGRRGAIAELDEARSHWIVVHTGEDERATTRALTFGACRARDDDARFADFLSLAHVRDQLRALVAPTRPDAPA